MTIELDVTWHFGVGIREDLHGKKGDAGERESYKDNLERTAEDMEGVDRGLGSMSPDWSRFRIKSVTLGV